MAVTAVVFDVGERLADETRDWERVADACHEALIEPHVDFVSSPERLGVERPSGERGPWAFLAEPPAEAVRIRSLDELPAAPA